MISSVILFALHGVGLRQGCVLSPMLFSLHINGLIDDLKQKQCGVASGSTQIPGLLYADDTSLFGEDAKTLQQSLHALEDWCQKWDMRVNVEKSAIIHFRDRSCEQCQDKFVVNGEVIPLVSSYSEFSLIRHRFICQTLLSAINFVY